jgi:hypothetical protein
MLNLVFFPKGMILMYNGANWQDNVTLKGWYQCKGGTVNGLTIPDLRDKFVMGYNGEREGGVNSQTLNSNNLPAHKHNFATSTTSKTLTGTFNPGTYKTSTGIGNATATGVFTYSLTGGEEQNGNSGGYGVMITMDATHTHSGTTDNNSTTATSFDNRPWFYALIYIIKVTDAGKDSF